MRNGGTKRDLENIFAAKERIEKLSIPEPMSGCWLWLGGVEQNQRGMQYGSIRIEGQSIRGKLVLQQTLTKLRGKNLACWCPLDQRPLSYP